MPRRPDIAALLAAKVVLAPMAGVADAPFRAICKRMGAGLTYTEMVSVKGLHFAPGSDAARRLLTLAPEETPCAVQIFGADPGMMAEQAARVVAMLGGDVALIDINAACPVPKVVARGEGCALMRRPELAAEIVRRVRDACPGVPVSVKSRKGWSAEEADAVGFALAMEAAGASALAVHGRTRSQLYDGAADWEAIAEVKRAVSIPVLGSGDVLSAGDALRMLESTGVDAVMIARGAQGNPWIFREARALIAGVEPPAPPSPLERVDLAREHAAAIVAHHGEAAFTRMRKHVAWYAAGLPGATHLRKRANASHTYAELDALLAEYRAYLEPRLSA